MILHPWHLISPGDRAPESVNAIIEIPRGSKAKYELDKGTGLLRLDRVLRTDLTYPAHYGFIPQTYCDDADPLDIILICSQPLLPLSIVEARVLGALHMIDGGEQDDKIIAVANNDYELKDVVSLETFPKDQLQAIEDFFKNYKKQEKKTVVIERIIGKQEAQQLVVQSIELYKKVFKK